MDFWKSPKKTIKAQNEPTLCVIEQKSVAHTYKVLYINKTFVITLPYRVVKKPGPTKTFYFIMFLTLFLLQTLIKHSFFLNAAGIVNFDYEASFKYIYLLWNLLILRIQKCTPKVLHLIFPELKLVLPLHFTIFEGGLIIICKHEN